MRTSAAVLALLVACAGISACTADVGVTTTPVVSRDVLQRDISERVRNGPAPAQTVTCDGDLRGEMGKSARCEVVMSPTASFEAVATVSVIVGQAVTYDVSPALSEDQLARWISPDVERLLGQPAASIACDTGLDSKPEAAAYCTAGDGEAVAQTAGGTGSQVALRYAVTLAPSEGLAPNPAVTPVLPKLDVAASFLDQLELDRGQRPDSAECTGDLQGEAGSTVDCTIRVGPDTGSYALTVSAVQGGVISYNYVRKA